MNCAECGKTLTISNVTDLCDECGSCEMCGEPLIECECCAGCGLQELDCCCDDWDEECFYCENFDCTCEE
jgi:hypothetical protein